MAERLGDGMLTLRIYTLYKEIWRKQFVGTTEAPAPNQMVKKPFACILCVKSYGKNGSHSESEEAKRLM